MKTFPAWGEWPLYQGAGEFSPLEGLADAPPIFFLSCQKENGPCTVQKKKRWVGNGFAVSHNYEGLLRAAFIKGISWIQTRFGLCYTKLVPALDALYLPSWVLDDTPLVELCCRRPLLTAVKRLSSSTSQRQRKEKKISSTSTNTPPKQPSNAGTNFWKAKTKACLSRGNSISQAARRRPP